MTDRTNYELLIRAEAHRMQERMKALMRTVTIIIDMNQFLMASMESIANNKVSDPAALAAKTLEGIKRLDIEDAVKDITMN